MSAYGSLFRFFGSTVRFNGSLVCFYGSPVSFYCYLVNPYGSDKRLQRLPGEQVRFAEERIKLPGESLQYGTPLESSIA
jgi:hypothetical protein